MAGLCVRCGQCCYFYDENIKAQRKCYHLKILANGKTACRIYRSKEPYYLDYRTVCMHRNDEELMPNCPQRKKEIRGDTPPQKNRALPEPSSEKPVL